MACSGPSTLEPPRTGEGRHARRHHRRRRQRPERRLRPAQRPQHPALRARRRPAATSRRSWSRRRTVLSRWTPASSSTTSRPIRRLTALLAELGVATQPTEMSLGHLPGLRPRVQLAGPARHASPSRCPGAAVHWRMIADIRRFYRIARDRLDAGADPRTTLGAFLEDGAFGNGFRNHFLVPVVSAVWSTAARGSWTSRSTTCCASSTTTASSASAGQSPGGPSWADRWSTSSVSSSACPQARSWPAIR